MRSVWALVLLAACGSKGSSKPAASKDAAVAKVEAPPDATPREPDQPVAPGDPYEDPAVPIGTLRITAAPGLTLRVVEIDVAGVATEATITTDASGTADLSGLVHDGSVAYHLLGTENGVRLESDPITLGDTGMRVELARGGIADSQEQVPPDELWVTVTGTGDATLTDVTTGALIIPAELAAGQLGPTSKFRGLVADHVYVARTGAFVSRPILGTGAGRSLMTLEVPMVRCLANLKRSTIGLRGYMRCELWQIGGAPRALATALKLPLPAGATAVHLLDPTLPLAIGADAITWTAPIRPGVVYVDVDYELPAVAGRIEVALTAPQAMARIGLSVEAGKTIEVTDVVGAQYQPPDYSEGDARHAVLGDYLKSGTRVAFVVTGVTPPAPCELLGDAPWTRTGDPAPAPDVVARTRDGAEVRLSSLRGKPVVLNLFASWTPPSKDEAPRLIALRRVLEPMGVELVVLASDASFDVVDPLIPAASGVTVWLDPQDGPSLYSTGKQAHAFGTTALPETYLIDADGLVRHWIVNSRDWTSPDALACVQTLKTKWTGLITTAPPPYVPPPPELAGTLDVAVDGPPGVLLLSAQSDGPNQPLSVVRIEHPTFPQAFTFGEGERFSKTIPLSGNVEVTARIDQDGDADTHQPGDRSGVARTKAGDLDVHVTIDQVVR